ncbi:hypothetical protein ACA910_014246 [Epithemia clementina (nom. ined.)]
MDWLLLQSEIEVPETVLRSVIDPVEKGPTCARPAPEQDVQWRKVAPNELQLRHQLPSVFSRSGFVRHCMTDRELGGVLDLPLYIVKGHQLPVLKHWVE